MSYALNPLFNKVCYTCKWGWGKETLLKFHNCQGRSFPVSGSSLSCNGSPLEAKWFMAAASPQPLRWVILQGLWRWSLWTRSPLWSPHFWEVSREKVSDVCGWAQGQGCSLVSQLWSPASSQPSPCCPAALPPPLFSSSRLGPDDAAGLRAEDPGPGPWRGSGGEEVGLVGMVVLPLLPGLYKGEDGHDL